MATESEKNLEIQRCFWLFFVWYYYDISRVSPFSAQKFIAKACYIRLYVRNRSNCAAPKLPGSYHTIEASKVLVRYVIPLFTITIRWCKLMVWCLQALKVASQFVVNQPMFQLQCKDIHLRNKTGSVVRHTHRRKVDSEYTPALLRTDNMHTRSLHVYLVFSE